MHPRTLRSSKRPLLVCSATVADFTCDRHTIGCTSSSRCRKSAQTRSKRLQAVCRTSCLSKLAFTPMMRRWWSQTGSNRRPHACKARALPAELWPRTRRRMLLPAVRRMRSIKVVGLGRLELPTSRLSSARSNQLSYKPELMTPPGADSKVPRLGRACPGRKRNEDGGDPA